jgi:dTDP-4-dehydrorhamnose reductase
MKIAVTGARGVLGGELIKTLGETHEMIPFPNRDSLDLRDFHGVRKFIAGVKPDAIVHPAAWRDPDPCEIDPPSGWRNNALTTLAVVQAAREQGAIMVHMSSDSVFPGDRNEPYHEFDVTGPPANTYGRTKQASENLVMQHLQRYFVVRLPLLFGRTPNREKNKLIQLFAAAKEGRKTASPGDAFSSVADCRDVALAVRRMLETEFWGVYHVASSPVISRAGMLQTALKIAGMDPSFVEVKTIAEQNKPAKRVRYSVLTSYLLEPVLGFIMPDWRDSMQVCITDLRAGGYVD